MSSARAMRLVQIALLSALLIGGTAPAVAASHVRRSPTSRRLFKKHAVKLKLKTHGQQTIDDERATQIQAALIHSGYLTGVPSGHWDNETRAAMEKMQADNGWQTKLVPDSRALIKLGLGPTTATNNSLYSQQSTQASSLAPSLTANQSSMVAMQ